MNDEPEEYDKMIQLGCDHWFHRDCIVGWVKNAIAPGSANNHILTCPECTKVNHDCNCPLCCPVLDEGFVEIEAPLKGPAVHHRIQDDEFQNIVKQLGDEEFSQEDMNRFSQRMVITSGMENAVEATAIHLITCPCQSIFEVSKYKYENDPQGTCPSCNVKICFLCRGPQHPGLKCHESNNVNFDELGLPSQQCPACNAIFTFGDKKACRHVSCLYCKYQFCYLCAAPHFNITTHSNAYHRPGCELYKSCCGKRCVEAEGGNKRNCEFDKYSPGPCAACKGTARHNTCTHRKEWKACGKCVKDNLECPHYCDECDKAGALCAHPTCEHMIEGKKIMVKIIKNADIDNE
jgi:hypothetical protein